MLTLGAVGVGGVEAARCKNAEGCDSPVELLSPNGGEKVSAGSDFKISWRHEFAASERLRLELITPTATELIAKGTPAGADGIGAFVWRVPLLSGKDFKVRIRTEPSADPKGELIAATSATDISDAPFEIQDVVAPVLQEMTLSTDTLDTTAGPASTTVRLHVTDDLAGLTDPTQNYIQINFGSPNSFFTGTGAASIILNINGSHRISGTDLDSVYQAVLTLPQYSAPGDWKIRSIAIRDAAGNNRVLYGALLEPYPNVLHVAGTSDQVAPTLQSLEFSTDTLDISDGPATTKVRLRLTDDLSGLGDPAQPQIQINIGSPNSFFTGLGGPSIYLNIYRSHRVSGTDLDSTYEADLSLPRYSPTGDWKIRGITIRDAAGNNRYLQGSLLTPYPHLLHVTGTGDQTPPVLQELAFSTQTLDTSSGPATTRVRVRVIDDLSGLSDPTLPLIQMNVGGPNSGTPGVMVPSVYLSIYRSHRVSGTDLDGIYEADLTLPQYSAIGDWQVRSINLRDGVGNSRTLWGALLDGFPQVLHVGAS